MRSELEIKVAEWRKIRAIVAEIVKNWTPIVEFNVQGQIMSIPAEILHRYKGSFMDQFFSKGYHGDRQYHEGRIFLERNPRVFRMVLRYIRNNGKMSLESLKQTDDYDTFLREMEFWKIDMNYDPAMHGPVDLTDTIVTASPKPVQQLRTPHSYEIHKSAAPQTQTTL